MPLTRPQMLMAVPMTVLTLTAKANLDGRTCDLANLYLRCQLRVFGFHLGVPNREGAEMLARQLEEVFGKFNCTFDPQALIDELKFRPPTTNTAPTYTTAKPLTTPPTEPLTTPPTEPLTTPPTEPLTTPPTELLTTPPTEPLTTPPTELLTTPPTEPLTTPPTEPLTTPPTEPLTTPPTELLTTPPTEPLTTPPTEPLTTPPTELLTTPPTEPLTTPPTEPLTTPPTEPLTTPPSTTEPVTTPPLPPLARTTTSKTPPPTRTITTAPQCVDTRNQGLGGRRGGCVGRKNGDYRVCQGCVDGVYATCSNGILYVRHCAPTHGPPLRFDPVLGRCEYSTSFCP